MVFVVIVLVLYVIPMGDSTYNFDQFTEAFRSITFSIICLIFIVFCVLLLMWVMRRKNEKSRGKTRMSLMSPDDKLLVQQLLSPQYYHMYNCPTKEIRETQREQLLGSLDKKKITILRRLRWYDKSPDEVCVFLLELHI